jgi:hypothetical protein
MYGSDMGSLNVLVDGNSVWTRSGDQGNSWKKADITIARTTNYKVKYTCNLFTETYFVVPYVYFLCAHMSTIWFLIIKVSPTFKER